MSIRDEVEHLMREAKGVLTAEQIVDKAKNAKRYPGLHDHLWKPDESVLAQEARIARAHKLMIRIQMTTEDGTTTRFYVHTRNTPGYQPLERVINNHDLAAAKLAELKTDISRARARLRSFASVLPEEITAEIDDALALAESKAVPVVERAA